MKNARSDLLEELREAIGPLRKSLDDQRRFVEQALDDSVFVGEKSLADQMREAYRRNSERHIKSLDKLEELLSTPGIDEYFCRLIDHGLTEIRLALPAITTPLQVTKDNCMLPDYPRIKKKVDRLLRRHLKEEILRRSPLLGEIRQTVQHEGSEGSQGDVDGRRDSERIQGDQSGPIHDPR